MNEKKWNLDYSREIEWGVYVQQKVMAIEKLEQESGVDIKATADILAAERAIKLKESKYGAKDLIAVRKGMGLTQFNLASKVGLSKAYICEMEKGRKPLSNSVLELISKNKKFLTHSKRPRTKLANFKSQKTNELKLKNSGVGKWNPLGRWDRKKNPIKWEDTL